MLEEQERQSSKRYEIESKLEEEQIRLQAAQLLIKEKEKQRIDYQERMNNEKEEAKKAEEEAERLADQKLQMIAKSEEDKKAIVAILEDVEEQSRKRIEVEYEVQREKVNSEITLYSGSPPSPLKPPR